MGESEILVTLEKVKIGMDGLIKESLLLDASFDVQKWVDGFRVNLSGYLLGEGIETKKISYPADWWQHFKKRWFPTCLLKRYPVKNITEVMEAKMLYTEFHNKISVPSEPRIVSLSKWDYSDDG